MATGLITVPVRPACCNRHELVPSEYRMIVDDTWLVFASRKPMIGHVSWVDYIQRLYYGGVALNTVDARDYIQQNVDHGGAALAFDGRATRPIYTDGVRVYEKEQAHAA